ncbi:hypothetical protein H9P43_000065 [Blastocladiella emersonii ATCC 22665]|nr:hypothetical protein H9P43_000065 [Blastocladiella emersonii ATCC 22665]
MPSPAFTKFARELLLELAPEQSNTATGAHGATSATFALAAATTSLLSAATAAELDAKLCEDGIPEVALYTSTVASKRARSASMGAKANKRAASAAAVAAADPAAAAAAESDSKDPRNKAMLETTIGGVIACAQLGVGIVANTEFMQSKAALTPESIRKELSSGNPVHKIVKMGADRALARSSVLGVSEAVRMFVELVGCSQNLKALVNKYPQRNVMFATLYTSLMGLTEADIVFLRAELEKVAPAADYKPLFQFQKTLDVDGKEHNTMDIITKAFHELSSISLPAEIPAHWL